jgi:hypothetical protein
MRGYSNNNFLLIVNKLMQWNTHIMTMYKHKMKYIKINVCLIQYAD